ncbi:hypothetical protein FOG50_01916 [Hanseniaspora uvarum]|nr:hypothetical protein FOG50_01916 [Hanseniaspora uvarum]
MDNEEKTIILVSGEGVEHQVLQSIISKSILIKNFLQDFQNDKKQNTNAKSSLMDDINDIDDDEDEEAEEQAAPEENDIVMPIPNVRSSILTKIIKWLEHHKNDTALDYNNDGTSSTSVDDLRRTDPLDEWDKQFFSINQETMYEIILASNYLNIPQLLDSGCKVIANMIRGKSDVEIRQIFNIEDDFTKEEKEAIRRENEWAEQI